MVVKMAVLCWRCGAWAPAIGVGFRGVGNEEVSHIWEGFYCGCLENCGKISIGDKYCIAHALKFVKLSL